MHVAIIGGGFSGTMVAVHSLRRMGPSDRIDWFERAAKFARGIAYGTPCSAHLLNVAAQAMTSDPEAPADLVEWTRSSSAALAGAGAPDSVGDAFLPRLHYGRYLTGQLDKALTHAHAQFMQHRLEVVEVRRLEAGGGRSHRWECIAGDGSRTMADHVVLALGHFLPQAPNVPGLTGADVGQFINDPWDYDQIAAIPRDAVVACLGAGLTMVDLLLQLHSQQFAGQVTAVSRRGLWPHTHATRPSAIALQPPPFGRAREIMAWLRATAGAHVAKGGDWRQVVDGLRPHIKPLWQALPPTEQGRLLRHAKSYWDVHRHRVAPEVGRLMAQMRHEGKLAHHAGRLVRAEPGKGAYRGKLLLTWRLRHSGEQWRQHVDALINCTGAHSHWSRATARLPRGLLAAGLVNPGPHGLGLAMHATGEVVGKDGQVQAGLWALGPARLGADFESVAVPELRIQAHAVATAIVDISKRQ